jgi:hypothetical protein
MTAKKKAAAKPAATKPETKAGTAAMPTHDGTDTVDQAAQDGAKARLETMAPDEAPKGAGQSATVSGPKAG